VDVADVICGTRAEVYSTTVDGVEKGISYPTDLNAAVSAVVVDSRTVSDGNLFVALKGERVDGHSYVKTALRMGASGAVVDRLDGIADFPPGKRIFVVDDTLAALKRLAGYWRRKHEVLVIGVTGSVGKTTVKEAVAWTLGGEGVLKSSANFNTEIGLPLELLRLRSQDRIAVLEMGMYQKGDIATLSKIARPDVGIVTNVLPVHLERTGSIEATAQGKAELVHSLPASGMAILNGEDNLVRAMANATAAQATLYGRHKAQYDFQACDIHGRGSNGFEAQYKHGSHGMRVLCPTPGMHNAMNVLPAIAAAHHIGVDWASIRSRVASFRVGDRMSFVPGPNRSVLLDDRYNASGASVVAAIELLMETAGRHFALLGDMYELGKEEEAQHRMVGKSAAGLDGLVLYGTRTRWIADEATRRGLPKDRVIQVGDNEQAIEAARQLLGPGDVMLIKGSRGMQLELVVEALTGDDVQVSDHVEDIET
jgi:UDP-N-acetylmuramoyl-tripeptide--D-alanyl-D-alanine ligase